MLRALCRPALGSILAVLALALVAPPAVPCGGTGGGLQGPAPAPPCVASTSIFKQNQRAIIGPYTGLTIPVWFSAQIQTSNCAPVSRVEFTVSLRSQATGQLVAAGSTTLNGPPVGTTFGVTVGALRLIQPSIPTGIYLVQGSARVVLTNGQAFTNGGDSCLAIVDPSPVDPALPRLDVELVNFPSGSVQAGDQMFNTYRITNNDPVHSYSGDFTVRNRSSAGLPTIDSFGPGSEPFFVYSIAAPVQGDNFPLAFVGDLPPGVCLPLPPNPADPAIPDIVSSLKVGPGETIELTVVSRGWGMCSGGSGCEQVAVLDGVFTDGTELDACAGGAVIIDDNAPPQYACDDGESGAAAFFLPPIPGSPELTWVGQPSPTDLFELTSSTPAPQLPMFIDGQPLPAQLQVVPMSDRWARYEWTVSDPNGFPLPPNALIQATLPIHFFFPPPNPGFQIVDAQIMPFPGEPFGHAEFFPFAKGMLAIDSQPTPLPIDSFFDVFVQIEAAQFDSQCIERGATGVGPNGERLPVENFSLSLAPAPFGAELLANMAVRVPPCPEGPQAVTFAINLKRGFARGVPQEKTDCPGDTNGDNIVNFADLNAVLSTFGQTGSGLAGDVNGDGVVNFVDLNIVLSNFGMVCA